MSDPVYKSGVLSELISIACKYNLPVEFLKKLCGRVSIYVGDLGSDAAQYNPTTNTLSLPNEYYNFVATHEYNERIPVRSHKGERVDRTSKVKKDIYRLKKMGASKIAKLYHEFYHAFFDRVQWDAGLGGPFSRLANRIIPKKGKYGQTISRGQDSLIALEELIANKIEMRIEALIKIDQNRKAGMTGQKFQSFISAYTRKPDDAFGYKQIVYARLSIFSPDVVFVGDTSQLEHYIDELLEGKTRQFLSKKLQNFIATNSAKLPPPKEPKIPYYRAGIGKKGGLGKR